jgi:hypothetical protein
MNAPKTPHLMVCTAIPEHNDLTGQQSQEWRNWLALLNDSEKIPTPSQGVGRPAENIWLIPVETRIHFYKHLILACDSHKVAYQTYFLEDAPRKCEPPA